ncbi:MAG: [protein-PII] uridylyltransferase [Nitrospirae bacterium]|nr:[protein-PII] uridylyltransferase [Nitrospirota bacterium]
MAASAFSQYNIAMVEIDDIIRDAGALDRSAPGSPNLKVAWDERRAAIMQAHREGASGRKVVDRLTRLTDDVLLTLYANAVARHVAGKDVPGLALVAVGGYGRGELNPHSDVDLLFLYDPRQADAAKAVSNDVLYPLWDLRLTVGHSVRTVADCVEVGLADLTAHTSMIETRLLAGDKELYQRFVREFTAKVAKKDVMSFLYRKAEEQRTRHQRFGATVFLQQPNVKESSGGLRDIHYLLWVAIARYGIGKLRGLLEKGLLDPNDYKALVNARGFFWHIRNELHFERGKSVDVLTFEEQLRLCRFFGFHETRTSRDVERFMRRYYLHASRVLDICSRFVDRATTRPLSKTLSTMIFSRKVAPYFVLTSREIRVDARHEAAFLADGMGILNLFHLAQAYGLRIHPDTVEMLSHARIPRRVLRQPDAMRVFLDILRWDSGVAETLGRMHRLRILGRVLPEFARVDRLVTFSQYHKFTVDAHTLYAVELLEQLAGADDVFGKVFREIRRKEILYLAVLLHDAGKGLHRDHCEVGEELAGAVAERFALVPKDTDLLRFLVRNHLEMSHIAFRRDLSDDTVLTQFARHTETPERLKMLFVLTHVDIRAVGPGTWNGWKEGLLTELYARSIEILAGRRMVVDMAREIGRLREKVHAVLGPDAKDWSDEILRQAPGRYLVAHSVDDICRHLGMIRKLKDNPALVEIVPQEDGSADITVCAHDRLVPALFSKIAGTLSAKDLQIYDARITTFRDDVVLDEFRVKDPNMGSFIDHDRWGRIRNALLDVLLGRVEVESLFVGGRGRKSHEHIAFSHTEPMVRIDNETSASFSIIDVFAADRQGLLYAITRAIAGLGLSVFFSRIATKADRVVDVFYVKDLEGGKVEDPERVEAIRARLLEVVTGHGGVVV